MSCTEALLAMLEEAAALGPYRPDKPLECGPALNRDEVAAVLEGLVKSGLVDGYADGLRITASGRRFLARAREWRRVAALQLQGNEADLEVSWSSPLLSKPWQWLLLASILAAAFAFAWELRR